MVYVIVMLITVSVMFVADLMNENTYKEKIVKSVAQIIAWIPVVFIAMFRYNVGTDYRLYTQYFKAVMAGRKSVWGSSVEIDKGLFYFNKFLQLFTDDSQSFFVVSSVFIYFAIFIYIKKSRKYMTFPILLFFVSGLFFTSLNVIRQFIAFALVLLFWKKLENGRYWLYIIGCVLACTFHLSAIILAFICIFTKLELSKGSFIRYILYTCLLMPIIGIVANLIVKYTRYSYYLSTKLYKIDIDITGIVYAILITLIVMTVYDDLASIKNGYMYCLMLFFYDAVVVCSFFIPLANRMAIYFKFFVFVDVLPIALSLINNKRIRTVMSIGVVLFFFSATVYLYMYRGLSNVNPYMTIWSK